MSFEVLLFKGEDEECSFFGVLVKQVFCSETKDSSFSRFLYILSSLVDLFIGLFFFSGVKQNFLSLLLEIRLFLHVWTIGMIGLDKIFDKQIELVLKKFFLSFFLWKIVILLRKKEVVFKEPAFDLGFWLGIVIKTWVFFHEFLIYGEKEFC